MLRMSFPKVSLVFFGNDLTKFKSWIPQLETQGSELHLEVLGIAEQFLQTKRSYSGLDVALFQLNEFSDNRKNLVNFCNRLKEAGVFVVLFYDDLREIELTKDLGLQANWNIFMGCGGAEKECFCTDIIDT